MTNIPDDMTNIIRPMKWHAAEYVACMICGHDWVAVYPKGAGKLECPQCGQMAGEVVKIHDHAWFSRFMVCHSPLEQERKTLVCLNAKRMEDERKGGDLG